VASDSEEEEEVIPTRDSDSLSSEEALAHEEGQHPGKPQPQVGSQSHGQRKPRVLAKGGVIAILSEALSYDIIIFKGLIQG
jgi:hypothetical protein